MAADVSRPVDAWNGLAGRRIFVEPQIYEQELERILTCCWSYQCEESQIPLPGGFFAADIGEDPVLALLDETKPTLKARASRLAIGMAWAEDLPSRTRHAIATIEVEPSAGTDELEVLAKLVVDRSHADTQQDFCAGARHDVLRRVGGCLRIATCRLVLGQKHLPAKNIRTFS